MNGNVLYELVIEKNHLTLIKQSLSLQINNLYEAVDADIVNTEKAYEDIKVLNDMLAVLRSSGRIVKQTSETTGLIWCKEVDLDEQYQKELESFVEYSEMCLDTFLKNHHNEDSINPSEAWNNVKERHWDTIKRMGDK